MGGTKSHGDSISALPNDITIDVRMLEIFDIAWQHIGALSARLMQRLMRSITILMSLIPHRTVFWHVQAV